MRRSSAARPRPLDGDLPARTDLAEGGEGFGDASEGAFASDGGSRGVGQDSHDDGGNTGVRGVPHDLADGVLPAGDAVRLDGVGESDEVGAGAWVGRDPTCDRAGHRVHALTVETDGLQR